MNHIKVFPSTGLLVAILVMAALHFVLPAAQVLPAPWNLLGIFPLVLGAALNVAGDNLFRKLGTTIRPGEPSTVLVTSGPFRLSRNPMYLGFGLILTGIATLLGSLLPFIVIPVFAAWIDRTFIQVEERMLADQFGAAWTAYRKKTRRWI
jgi:protein-S-isoprenylcysteine O-methyltransferase Ste14